MAIKLDSEQQLPPTPLRDLATSDVSDGKLVLNHIFKCGAVSETVTDNEMDCLTVNREEEDCIPELNTAAEVESYNAEALRKSQLADPDIAPLVLRLEKNEGKPEWKDVQASSETLRVYWSQWDALVIQDGVLYRTFWRPDGLVSHRQLVVPFRLRSGIIRTAHEGVTGGHFGFLKTKEQVQRRAYWHTWQRDVCLYCRRCDVCCRVHRGKAPKQGLLQSFVAGAPWD